MCNSSIANIVIWKSSRRILTNSHSYHQVSPSIITVAKPYCFCFGIIRRLTFSLRIFIARREFLPQRVWQRNLQMPRRRSEMVLDTALTCWRTCTNTEGQGGKTRWRECTKGRKCLRCWMGWMCRRYCRFYAFVLALLMISPVEALTSVPHHFLLPFMFVSIARGVISICKVKLYDVTK